MKDEQYDYIKDLLYENNCNDLIATLDYIYNENILFPIAFKDELEKFIIKNCGNSSIYTSELVWSGSSDKLYTRYEDVINDLDNYNNIVIDFLKTFKKEIEKTEIPISDYFICSFKGKHDYWRYVFGTKGVAIIYNSERKCWLDERFYIDYEYPNFINGECNIKHISKDEYFEIIECYANNESVRDELMKL